jgi:tetratricopeptide (TPR) repeat protein
MADISAPPAATAYVAAAGPGFQVSAAANRSIEDLGTAERLIASGRFSEGRDVLYRIEKSKPRDPQVQFLLALLDRRDTDYDRAVQRLRRILVDEPKAERVRLELGRTFFEAGDYNSAERQFRYARAGNLPSAVVQNVDRYLGAIRQRKTFSMGLSLAISSDSNLNAGPATDTITLYGLPFQLSQNAKATSGVGLVGDLSAEWAPRIASGTKLRIGTQVRRAQYKESDFNDMTVAFYAGPRLNLKKWEFNVLGNVARRWYGEKVYTNQIGGGVDTTYFVSSRFGISAGINLGHVRYERISLQSGMSANIGLTAFYAPTPASFLRVTGQVGRQKARSEAYANRSWLAALQYTHELKGGLTASLAPGITRISYDGPLAAFGTSRRDTQLTGQASLLSRRIDVFGVTPKLVYTYTRNRSSIPLFEFSRGKAEVVLTSNF